MTGQEVERVYDSEWAAEQFKKNIRKGEEQFFLWQLAQSEIPQQLMIEPFRQAFGRTVSIATISRYIAAEVDEQRKHKDRTAEHLREVGTTLLERNNAIRLELVAEARHKGALVTASQLLDGSDRNIEFRMRIHGAVAPVVTKVEADVTTHTESISDELDQLMSASDDYEERLLMELQQGITPNT